MVRNIVILLDGTSNEIEADRTNILRLYGTLEKSDEQLVYYDPGVGTFGAADAWSRLLRKAGELWGMATGAGIDANVMEAYSFLVHNYRHGEDGANDRIYIFGFSRGAYTARVLAGFIHAFGLIEPRNLNLLKYAYRAHKRIGEDARDEDFAEIELHRRVLRPHRPPIRLLGLFDTVASVLERGGFWPRFRKHGFSSENSSVEAVRHAVAIGERRRMFRPQLWKKDQKVRSAGTRSVEPVEQDFKEVWFTGAHGDVGGGYPEAEAQLAKIPLDWMIQESTALGLSYEMDVVNALVLGKGDDSDYAAPDATRMPHDSMTTKWRLLEYFPRRVPPGSERLSLLGRGFAPCEWRAIPADAAIHPSVFEQDARPPNIPDQ